MFSDTEKKCVGTCCANGKYYNFNANSCLCPQSQPFEDADGKCINCMLPNYFNKVSRRCESCPEATIYDLQKETCVACPADKPISVGLECIGCRPGFIFDSTTKKCKCPDNKPYTDGNVCYECTFPNFWNTRTL